MRRLLVTAVAGLVALGCVGPSRSLDDYRDKAANTAEATISAVQTARLATTAASDGRAFSRYLSLVLSEAETDAGSVRESFTAVQPPGGAEADRLRAGLGSLLDEVVTVLADLRIAAYRGDGDALVASAERLPELVRRLERYRGITTT